MPLFVLGFWHRLSKHQILWLTALIGVILILSAALFAWTQHVSWFLGLYWAVTTVTTVGYGDVTPHNTIGRVIAMGTMLTAIPLAGVAFGGWTAALVSMHLRRMWGLAMNKTHDHLVILGDSPLLNHVLPDLLAQHEHIVVVSPRDPASWPAGVTGLSGDPTQPHTLAQAHLSHARQILVLGDQDGTVLMSAIEAHRLAPSVPLFAVTQSRQAAQTLKDLGLPHSVASQDLLGHMLAKSLETPHAADFFITLLTDAHRVLQEIPAEASWAGRPLDQLPISDHATVLAIVRAARILTAVDRETLHPGDRLLCVMDLSADGVSAAPSPS